MRLALIFLLLCQALPAQQQARRQADAPKMQAGASPIAAEVDETPAVTHHEIRAGDKTLRYTATAAQMPLFSPAGETEAHVFYVAYTLEGVSDASKRPLTFAFNGGPGSASMWVHMGAMGPRKPKLLDNGDMPAPPFKIVDNENTWLDQTDLVFIDPVGTGYSRARTIEIARRMNGVQGDLQSVGEFIRMYINRNQRWLSPLYIAGESYGTTRAAGLAGHLIDQGIAFNGITLISTVLNFQTIRPGLMNGLSYALHLPTYTADAFYHKKLPADLQKDLPATLKQARTFAITEYLDALNKGDTLPPAERKAMVDKVARFTGLEPRYVDYSDLRFDVAHFTRELLRSKTLTIGRLDGRLTGPASRDMGERSEFDPSSTLPRPPFQAAFLTYVRSELNYKTDMNYYVSGGIQPWDWGSQNNFVDTGVMLRNAFAKNPHLKVMVCAGYYDLATPFFAAEYTFDHMGLSPEMRRNVSWQYYASGHMMYIDKEAHAKLKRDITEFIHNTMPEQ